MHERHSINHFFSQQERTLKTAIENYGCNCRDMDNSLIKKKMSDPAYHFCYYCLNKITFKERYGKYKRSLKRE